MADGEEFSTSALYRDNPEWADVKPIYPTKEEEGAVRIAVSEQFRDAFAYFRAVLASGEMSSRVFLLTEDCIQLNPANYTLWQFRRELLKKLEVDLSKELKYLDDIIMQTPKNYQVWHHRRCVVEWIGASVAENELTFTAQVIEDESKNYHAWQYRQWILRHFVFTGENVGKGIEKELAFTSKLLFEDPRNNSAWNNRYFVLQTNNKLGDPKTLENEITLAKRFIEKMPHNESVWNYLAGLLLQGGLSSRVDVVDFVEDLYERTEAPKRAPYLISFLCDILLENIENDVNAAENCKRAKELYNELVLLDPVRSNYWKYQIRVAENLLERRGFKTVAKMQQRDLGHKVLVVLDHGSRFAKMAANPFSVTLKESNVNRVVGACDKSLWTWCVEATLELHRVVFDLFSGEHDSSHARLMRLVLADCVGRVLQPRWGTEIVTQQEILNSLSSIGLPSTSDDTDGVTLSGITLAVEALSQLSDAQMNGDAVHPAEKKEKTVTKERTNFSRMPKCWETPSTSSEVTDTERKVVENAGSIVIFTSFTEAERLTELEREVADVIKCRNRIIKSLQDSSFACISHVKMYIINVLPRNHQCGDLSSFKEITPELSSCIYSRPAGDDLISVIHSVAIDIYDLVSTTVSGIPMKEEAQQGQSAVAINYDVELLHSREVHIELERLGLVVGNTMKNDITGTLMVYAENSTYPTARLVWSTPMPKGRWNMFPRNRHVSRVTPSAVNSRPSVCLSSYLLQGRNVMLEITRVPRCEGILSNVGAKLIAHTLIAHGGHIYIHANDVGTHSVLDCPTIRDKSQLKKTAHGRVADFVSLIKESSLHLVEPGKETEKASVSSGVSCYQPRRQLLRITRYWPLRSDQCYIYNIPKRFDALFNILRQPHLSTVDADKCKQVIHQLVALKDSRERIGEPSTPTQLLKDGSSREEQLKLIYLEMARHLGNYMNHSEKHSEIFYLFLQATNLERAIKMSTADVSVLDRSRSNRQETSGSNFAVASASAISSAASEVRNLSRSNSPLPKKPRKSIYLWKPNETLNLYEYLMEKEERHHRAHWVDFVGRVKAGNRPAHLYPNLDLSASTKQD